MGKTSHNCIVISFLDCNVLNNFKVKDGDRRFYPDCNNTLIISVKSYCDHMVFMVLVVTKYTHHTLQPTSSPSHFLSGLFLCSSASHYLLICSRLHRLMWKVKQTQPVFRPVQVNMAALLLLLCTYCILCSLLYVKFGERIVDFFCPI